MEIDGFLWGEEWKNCEEKETLCWHCKNAVPEGKTGCPWSRGFEPVVGWRAVREIWRPGEGVTESVEISYFVKECPLFVEG